MSDSTTPSPVIPPLRLPRGIDEIRRNIRRAYAAPFGLALFPVAMVYGFRDQVSRDVKEFVPSLVILALALISTIIDFRVTSLRYKRLLFERLSVPLIVWCAEVRRIVREMAEAGAGEEALRGAIDEVERLLAAFDALAPELRPVACFSYEAMEEEIPGWRAAMGSDAPRVILEARYLPLFLRVRYLEGPLYGGGGPLTGR